MTNYRITIIGKYGLMPRFIKELEVDEEWSKNLAEGFYAFVEYGSYTKIGMLIERLKYLKQLDVDIYFSTMNTYGRMVSYNNIEDPLGIWKEIG